MVSVTTRLHFRPHPWVVLPLLMALAGCPGPEPTGDPCEPGGHIHRGPTDAASFCHCEPGWMAAQDRLACVPDDAADMDFPFEVAEADACALAERGLTATAAHSEPPEAVNAFDTVYTLTLAQGSAGFHGTFVYDAHQSGKALVYVGGDVPFAWEEDGRGVDHEVGPVPTSCDDFRAVIGVHLTAGVRYTLEIGPTPDATATLLIRLVP